MSGIDEGHPPRKPAYGTFPTVRRCDRRFPTCTHGLSPHVRRRRSRSRWRISSQRRASTIRSDKPFTRRLTRAVSRMGGGLRSRSHRLWSIGAVGGIVIGLAMLIAGDSFRGHELRLLGALITAEGLLCAVVRFAGQE